MSEAIAGQVFFLTGCASGIGRHLTGALLRRGAAVHATDLHLDALRAAAAEDGWDRERADLHALDVRSAAQWEARVAEAAARHGRIDVLMNIAGVSLSARIHEAPIERIELHLDVNTKGTMFGCRFGAAQMVAQGRGHLVNFASIASFVPVPYMSLYNASKFAVRGFSLAIAEELRPHGVAVTAICPDAVATPMLDSEAAQVDAALNFAGSRIYTVEDIEELVFKRVLPKRPAEALLAGWLGPLARAITAYPRITRPMLDTFREKGARNQQRYLESIKRRGSPSEGA